MKSARIAIVGGGVIGASAAYHLSLAGARKVQVVERECELGLGSTGKATGGVRAQFETDINISMSLYSLDFFRSCGFDCGYEPRGYIFLARTPEQLEYLKRSTARQRELGYQEVRVVDVKEIERLSPGLNLTDIVGGSFGPRDGFIDPMAVLEGFRSEAVNNGAAFQTEKNIRRIITNNGAVRGLETDQGEIECDIALITAGTWSAALSASCGIDLPVAPAKRQIAWVRVDEPLSDTQPMVIDLDDGFHFRPAKGSRTEVLMAVPVDSDPENFSTDFEPAFAEFVRTKARHRAPFLADAELLSAKCRAGLYENTPDHHAIIGRSKVEGLYFACGFSGHGVMHSPAAGRAVSEIILNGRSEFLDVSSLDIGRFERDEMHTETAFI